jgi:murein DD-endopeptidase MepM/ murein hydrolase activator NlpD
MGMRDSPVTPGVRKQHEGLDLSGKIGQPVYAIYDGTVVVAKLSQSAGLMVRIDHGGGLSTSYMHLSTIMVEMGQKVRAGQQIGQIGATGRVTGPHLHLEVRVNNQPVHPTPEHIERATGRTLVQKS